MSVDISVNQDKQTIQIKGDLVAKTVMQVMRQFTREFQSMAQWVIDLSEVGRVDSTAIALLIELKRLARANNRSLRFVALPESLLTIAHLSQVDDLLLDEA